MPRCAVSAPKAGGGQSVVIQERLEAREVLVVKKAAQNALVNASGLVLGYDGGYLPIVSTTRQSRSALAALHRQRL